MMIIMMMMAVMITILIILSDCYNKNIREMRAVVMIIK